MAAAAVLINADDLGLHPAVDRGIFAAWAAGAVGDSTVFANTPDLATLLARARAAGLPVGIHLNLTFGRPVSDPADLPALVTADGAFMKRKAWTLPLPAAQVRHELAAQIARVLALGGRPTHLDSHHHVHTYPEVLEEVIALARAHDVPVRSVNAEMRAGLRAAGVATPEDFSMAFYGEHATVDTLIALVEGCLGGVLEIMTHPGEDHAGIPSSYRAERARELAALTAPRWRGFLAVRGIPVVGYRALG